MLMDMCGFLNKKKNPLGAERKGDDAASSKSGLYLRLKKHLPSSLASRRKTTSA
jgi:hypothetical protein